MIKIVGRLGFCVVIFLALVGLASVAARFVNTVSFLADPASIRFDEGGPGPPRVFEERYYANPHLTLVHLVSGFLFMTLGPLQFVAAVRNRWLPFHRWCGRVFLVASLVGVVSALAFVRYLPVFGSYSTQVGVVFASVMFLVCLVAGYRAIRQRRIAQHREWMIRLMAIGLGISTFRVLLPLLMMPPLRVSFPEAWDTVVWLGFGINAITAEVWINVTRPLPAARVHVPASKARTHGVDVQQPTPLAH